MKNIGFIIGNVTRSAGTERAVINLCNSLSGVCDCKVFIISMYSNNSVMPYYSVSKSVGIIHLGFYNNGRNERITSYIKLNKYIHKLSKRYEIGTIIGTGHQINSIIAYIRTDVKKIGWEHMIYEAPPLLSRLIRRAAYKRLNHIVLLTDADCAHYRFIESGKKSVIKNIGSFETNRVSSLKNKRIIYAGRLSPVKDIPALIRIMQIVFDEIPDWHLDIFGDGDEKDLIISMIKRMNLSNNITLHKPTENIKKEFLSSSIAVLTSLNEGMPMVLIEAQICGLPVVSFDCKNGPAEIISDSINGFLVANRDEREFAEKVIILAKDEVLRNKFGKQAKNNSFKFNDKEICNQWIKILKYVEG